MRKLSLIVFLFVLALDIHAQSDSCKVLLEKISGSYKGKCQNGLANGKGESTGEETYIGTFKDGLPDGKGKYFYKNGDFFHGYWKKGQRHGKGKFKYTSDGEKNTLFGYWKNDEYVGDTDPDITYKVTSVSGIMDYKVVKNDAANAHDNAINLSIKSAFTEFTPTDLRIERSSGHIMQSGKRYSIVNYFCPLQCEINYTILTGVTRKQCRFIIEIYEEGKYTITLNND